MCNNVATNILKKEEVKRKEKDQISDWLEKRKCIRKNIYAKKMNLHISGLMQFQRLPKKQKILREICLLQFSVH